MATLTDFAENKLIDALLRGQSLGAPATWYIAALTAASDTELPTVTEVSGGSYARVAVTASLANFSGTQSAGSTVASTGTGGVSSNNGTITFPAPTGNWGSIVALAMYDASSGGNCWLVAPLGTPKTVNSGDPAPTVPANNLVITAS